MIWTFRVLMSVSIIGAGFVAGHILPVEWAAVFTAVSTAAALFHPSASQATVTPTPIVGVPILNDDPTVPGTPSAKQVGRG